MRAGLRNPKKAWSKQFTWLDEIISTISKANRFHNWGVEWDRFYKTCQALVEEGYDIKSKVTKFFSATRFANYAVKIYTRFRYKSGPIIKIIVLKYFSSQGELPSADFLP